MAPKTTKAAGPAPLAPPDEGWTDDASLSAPEAQSVFASLLRHNVLHLTVACLPIQADIMTAQRLHGGNVADAAKFLSTTASLCGLSEFLVNPSLGSLSDTFGRRRFMMIGSAYHVVGNLLVALLPQSRTMFAINRFVGGASLTVSGSVIGTAVVSDLSSGSLLAQNIGRFFASFGTGVISTLSPASLEVQVRSA